MLSDSHLTIHPHYICGATCSGKSAYALALAEKCNGEIVNADAFQLYRGIETITAAPSQADREKIPHHLYGVFSVAESCDAAKYAALAAPVITEIISRGKTPIITGGSGLYLKFLTHGASPLPTGDEKIRAELELLDTEKLLEKLELLDPKEAAQISRQNRRYLIRSLEVCLLTNRPISEQRDAWLSATAEKTKHLSGTLIQIPRETLHTRIALRTKQMLSHGAIEEIANIETFSLTAQKAIGISQIQDYIAGKISLSTCEELITTATRQYAKRQETWFRRERWLTTEK